jgi:hypothetical protein
MTVDEAGRDQAALAVDVVSGFEIRGRFTLRPGINNGSVARGDQTARDGTESFPVRRQRRKVSVSPDAVTVHGGTL